MQECPWDSEEAMTDAARTLVAGSPLWARGRVLLQFGDAGAAELRDGALQRLWHAKVGSFIVTLGQQPWVSACACRQQSKS